MSKIYLSDCLPCQCYLPLLSMTFVDHGNSEGLDRRRKKDSRGKYCVSGVLFDGTQTSK